MKKNYTQYQASQFVADPFFLQWRIVGDKRSTRFWETFIRTHPEKKEEIQEAIRILQTVRVNDYTFSKDEAEQLLSRIKNSGKQGRQRKRRWMITYSAAAGIALLLSLTFFQPFSQSGDPGVEQTIASTSLIHENIRLITAGQQTFELDNNSDIVCQAQGSIQIKKGEQHKMLQKQNVPEPGMNTLIVPHGKRTLLTLPDNTQIWLNAGSKVEFPTQFTDGKREIYAEGEVYLEVAKDSAYPFIVRTPYYNVRVLGTKFNISAYPDESEHAVVLAEGAVEVGIQGHSPFQLSPNHKLTVCDKKVEVTEAIPYEYICWKDGLLQFSQETLPTILNRISHYYGVEIQYEATSEERINGKLVLFEDIQTVLDNIAVIFPISYQIQDHQIQIVRTP